MDVETNMLKQFELPFRIGNTKGKLAEVLSDCFVNQSANKSVSDAHSWVRLARKGCLLNMMTSLIFGGS